MRGQPETSRPRLVAIELIWTNPPSTLDAAYALGDETLRGHLAPGTLGDATILSGDVSSATADGIRAMEVIATIVDGIVVY